MNRRRFIQALGTTLVTPYALHATQANAGGGAPADVTPGTGSNTPNGSANWESVFTWSVASGDPSASGAVIWTRINPAVYSANKTLTFDVSPVDDFSSIQFSGSVNPSDMGPDRDYTVNIDLDGQLTASGTYYYRFHYDGEISRTGRFKTLAQSGQSLDKLRVGVLTCQDYSTGYFNAFSRLAEEELDFVIHLGDFIYEYAEYEGYSKILRPITMPSGYNKCNTLEDYRHVYRLHREDKNLQAAMEKHAFVIVWDDHETADNTYWDYENDTLGLPKHDDRHTNDAATLRQLRLDAQRAWVEYVPARVEVDENASHPFDYLKMYRQLTAGNLVDLYMTDSRTYRTEEACADGGNVVGCTGNGFDSPTQTMLGTAQRNWMVSGMSNSNATWKVWGNQTMLGQLALTLFGAQLSYFNLDAWDGYQHERQGILTDLKNNGVDNRLVVLTGDMHTSLASYIKLDFGNINNWNYDNLSGVEIMTPSVTSPNINDVASNAVNVPLQISTLAAGGIEVNNPHVKDFSGGIHGYAVVQFNQDDINWWVYNIDVLNDNPNAGKQLHHEFRYEAAGTWIRKVS